MCLLRQKYACCNKVVFVETKIFGCNKHNFVMSKVVTTKDMFCHNRTFVASNMILVAAPANDTRQDVFSVTTPTLTIQVCHVFVCSPLAFVLTE